MLSLAYKEKQKRSLHAVAVITFLFTIVPSLSWGQDTSRYALVIAAKNYYQAKPHYTSFENARSMSAALKSKGFQVEEVLEPQDVQHFQDVIHAFYNKVRKNPKSISVIFYSGFGIQSRGKNFLMPQHARIKSMEAVPSQCYSLDTLLAEMKNTSNFRNIAIVDAHRDIFFFNGPKDLKPGLSAVKAPSRGLIVFTQSPEKYLRTDYGKYEPFIAALCKNIQNSGKSMIEIVKSASNETVEKPKASRSHGFN